LAVGGYLIVDDYGVMERHECRRAVDEFRSRYDISEPLEEVDWTCVRWRRRHDARVDPAPRARASNPIADVAPRSGAPRIPTGRELELEHEVAALRERLRAPSWRRGRR
jgi:Macrocin-O-methyltransferase (TylF)